MKKIWYARLPKGHPEFQAINFEFHEIIEKNALNQPVNKSYFEITRDGFVFLCMGFTGRKAAQFKEQYIAEFVGHYVPTGWNRDGC